MSISSNGFSEKSISFLNDLGKNNDRKWFELNRSSYEEYVLAPMKQLVIDLGPLMKDIDDRIDITPQINKTISKIYRDTRFSHDKAPLRSDQWITFKRPVRIFGNVPEFYLYFTPEEYHIGMGYYASTPGNMEDFRDKIDINPSLFAEIVKKLEVYESIGLYGDDYRRQFSNNYPEQIMKWYRKRSFYLSEVRMIGESFFSPLLSAQIKDVFSACSELYLFMVDKTN
jgi:uncharacterized protein (TIGR02453 family)